MTFYDVHCTNCGKVMEADRMAINVDTLIKKHLSIMAGKSRKDFFITAEELLKSVKIGIFSTKFELVRDEVLSPEGTLKIDCGFILKYIEQRYHIKIEKDEKEQAPVLAEKELEEDESLPEFFGDVDNFSDNFENDDYDIAEDILEKLCFQMAMYNERDISERDKRRYIERLVKFLLNHKEEQVLECECKFPIQQDDKGQEFIGSVEVRFIDEESVIYRHMVCPYCGEELFIDAGKHQEHVIVMLGSSRVGKTAYLAALVDSINPFYGCSKYENIAVHDTTDQRYTSFKEKVLNVYRNGMKVKKTEETEEAVPLFSLELSIDGNIQIFTFVDLPGEVFVPRNDEEKERGEAEGRFIVNHRKICYSAEAFWFCIDPVQIDMRLEGMNDKNDGADRVEQDMDMIFANIENIVYTMGADMSKVPTAIIITKSDTIDPVEELYSGNPEKEPRCLLEDNKFTVDRYTAVAANVKKYLKSPNVKNIIPKINMIFQKKNYFSVAAYGVEVVAEARRVTLAPFGIMLPLLWTLTAFGCFTPMAYRREVQGPTFWCRRERVLFEGYKPVEEEELFD